MLGVDRTFQAKAHSYVTESQSAHDCYGATPAMNPSRTPVEGGTAAPF
jgi:hypothetical protein